MVLNVATVRSREFTGKAWAWGPQPHFERENAWLFGHVERSSGAVSTACRKQIEGRRGQGGPSWHQNCWRKTAMSGSSQQLTLKKGAPGDQVWDLLCVQLASYLERGPLMWMMPLHVNQKSNYGYDSPYISLCKTCDPWGGAIFGPRGVI